MFKDIYKAANNDITPDPELINNILSKAEPEPRPEFRPFIFRYAFSACAAVIALAILLPSVTNKSDTGTVTMDSTPRKITESQLAPQIVNNEAVTASDNTSDVMVQNTPVQKQAKSKQAENSTNKPFPITDETGRYRYTTPDQVGAQSTDPKSPVFDFDGSANVKEQPEEITQNTFVLSVNNITTIAPESAMAFALETPAEGISPEVTYEQMPVNDYFNYVGFSPTKLAIPENLTADYNFDSTVDISKSGEKVVLDTATFTYSGEKFISVTTSTDKTEVNSVLENEDYTKTAIGDNSAVVLYDGSVYQGYMISPGGAAVIINSVDLTEEEFTDLIVSAAQ